MATCQLSRASWAPLLSLATRQKLLPEPQVGQALWSVTHAQVSRLWKSPEELAPGPSVLLGLGA